jgi:hypothetical protein
MTHLKITSLRYDPFVDKLLRILCKTEKEFSICLQLVDGFNCLMYLVIQALQMKEKILQVHVTTRLLNAMRFLSLVWSKNNY